MLLACPGTSWVLCNRAATVIPTDYAAAALLRRPPTTSIERGTMYLASRSDRSATICDLCLDPPGLDADCAITTLASGPLASHRP